MGRDAGETDRVPNGGFADPAGRTGDGGTVDSEQSKGIHGGHPRRRAGSFGRPWRGRGEAVRRRRHGARASSCSFLGRREATVRERKRGKTGGRGGPAVLICCCCLGGAHGKHGKMQGCLALRDRGSTARAPRARARAREREEAGPREPRRWRLWLVDFWIGRTGGMGIEGRRLACGWLREGSGEIPRRKVSAAAAAGTNCLEVRVCPK